MYRSLVIIDEIYDAPHEVRRAALGFDYPEITQTRKFPGRNSRERVAPPELDRVVSDAVGEPVVAAIERGSSHGAFRVTLAGETGRYQVHVDPSGLAWVGVVYLSLPEHCQGGTAFFRHKGLDSDRVPRGDKLAAHGVPDVESLLQRDSNDPDKWQHLMTVPMRFNRMILYRPWLWHSATDGFGQSPEDSRLIQVLAFKPAGTRQSALG